MKVLPRVQAFQPASRNTVMTIRRISQTGFSLVEALIPLTVAGVLLGSALPTLNVASAPAMTVSFTFRPLGHRM